MDLYRANSMKIVAILATYNEERFVANCVRNLVAQGASIYLIDNESTDATIRHVRETAGNALLEVESFPRHGIYSWQPILERKEQIANRIEADWLMHVDADEIHLPPLGSPTLAHAFHEADEAGHNAAKSSHSSPSRNRRTTSMAIISIQCAGTTRSNQPKCI